MVSWLVHRYTAKEICRWKKEMEDDVCLNIEWSCYGSFYQWQCNDVSKEWQLCLSLFFVISELVTGSVREAVKINEAVFFGKTSQISRPPPPPPIFWKSFIFKDPAPLWEIFDHIFSSIYFIKYAMFDMKYFLGCLPTIFGAHITWVTSKRRKYGFV